MFHTLTQDDGVPVFALKLFGNSIFKELIGSFLIFYELVAGIIFLNLFFLRHQNISKHIILETWWQQSLCNFLHFC